MGSIALGALFITVAKNSAPKNNTNDESSPIIRAKPIAHKKTR